MLVNSDTGSAGETAVLYGKSLRNYSHIICRIPNVINLCEDPADCMEGQGFTPDYWVDRADVEGEVLHWIEGNIDA